MRTDDEIDLGCPICFQIIKGEVDETHRRIAIAT